MVSWDGEKPSKPKKQRGQKCTKKGSLFWTPIEASRGKKGKIRYVLNGISENPTYPDFGGQKIVTFQAAWRWQNHYLSASLRHHETPIKQARNRFQGNLDAPRGPNPPLWEPKCDQIPLLQHIYIYIYMRLRVLKRTPFSSFHESLKELQFRIRAKPLQK